MTCVVWIISTSNFKCPAPVVHYQSLSSQKPNTRFMQPSFKFFPKNKYLNESCLLYNNLLSRSISGHFMKWRWRSFHLISVCVRHFLYCRKLKRMILRWLRMPYNVCTRFREYLPNGSEAQRRIYMHADSTMISEVYFLSGMESRLKCLSPYSTVIFIVFVSNRT
jgi:hypothetical protein